MYRRILFSIVGLLAYSASAQAVLVVDLTNDGSGGVIATFTGSGITTGNIGSSFRAANVGDYVAASHGNSDEDYDLAAPLSFNAASMIESIEIDLDPGSSDNDDFEIDFDVNVGSGVAFDVSGSSFITGLAFADLIVGSYSGSSSNEVTRIGGFTLNVIDSVAVPEPASVALLMFGAAAFGLRRRRLI